MSDLNKREAQILEKLANMNSSDVEEMLERYITGRQVDLLEDLTSDRVLAIVEIYTSLEYTTI